MAVEKVKYICAAPAFLGEKQKEKERLQKELADLMGRLTQSLKKDLGWLQLERTVQRQKNFFYYNQNIRGLFPDLSKPEYTAPLFPINSPVDINRIFVSGLPLEGMQTSLIGKAELRAAFPSKSRLEQAAARWNWSPGLFSQYFAVLPCEQGTEVCRIDGGRSTYWGAKTSDKACLIITVHLANYVSGSAWQDDILFLMRKGFLPVPEGSEQDAEFLAQYGAFLKSEDGTLTLDWNLLEHSENTKNHSPGTVLRPADPEQSRCLQAELLECDYIRSGLPRYDESILTPLNGHWDLWEYVRYNDLPEEQLPPPPSGKIWVDVSKENFYARNAADDLAPDAETVAVDFGTKSTTVARMDNEGNIVTLLMGAEDSRENRGEGQDSGKDFGCEKGYENPTILKYIDLDSFQAAYASAQGRPMTKFSDLSASHGAEREFMKRTLEAMDGILAYQYQIKQWAYDNRFAPLIFDKHRQIRLKPYREIGEEDFDPIEAYAYLVGLTIVNMRRSICTRYVLSYPPSYGADICKKMCRSFERGIRKAIPVEAQQTAAFRSGFSVLLRQSEPAAYAVCAIKEFGIGHERALCGVYDLGGGTVDYHFGIFTGGEPPYRYESRQNGGNPRLGCENILEALVYEVFSLVKEKLRENKIPYEFPGQYPDSLEDIRYTSHSHSARFNTLGMLNALRQLWIRNFQTEDAAPDRLCYFQIYTETKEALFLEIEAAPAKKDKEFQAEWKKESEKTVKILLDPDFLKNFFREKLATTVWEFLDMQRMVRADVDGDLPLVIFLAGNGSQAPMVTELFQEYLPRFQMENCQLYPPLGTREAAEQGQWIQNRTGSVPNAKTGVAHGLLIALPGSDFIKIVEPHRNFMFRFHVGVSRYSQETRERLFHRRKSADRFELYEKYAAPSEESLEAPFSIEEDGHLQIWYTDAAVALDSVPIKACGARQFLIRIPDAFLSEQPCQGMRGECYYQAVSETELELFIRPMDVQENCCPYGILNLDNGHFEPHPYNTGNE